MSSRTAAARKRLQDPRPKTSPSERSVNQAKLFPSTSRLTLTTSIPPLRTGNIAHITIPEYSTYSGQLDLSNEFPQSPPPLEYSRAYSLHPKSSDTTSSRIESSQATPAVSTYSSSSSYTHQSRYPLLRLDLSRDIHQAPPPLPPNPTRLQSPKRTTVFSYADKPLELPFLPNYPPPSPTGYPGYSEFSPPSPSSPLSNRNSTLTDLPEYRSTCTSRPGSLISGPPFQDNAINNLNLICGDNSYHYPSSSRSGHAAQLAPLSPVRNERVPYRIFPDTQCALNSPAQSPIHELPGDSGSLSGSRYSGTYSTSTEESQPPAPPPSPNFVFPGSRSVARPKVSSKINLQLKFGSKSRLRSGKDREGTSHSLDVSSQNSHATFETEFLQVPVQSNHPDAFPEENSAVIGDDQSRKIKSSVHNVPKETFVFPTSRSRAQPKLKPSKPFRSSRDVNQPEGQSRFMGMFKKKNAKAPNLEPNGIVSESIVHDISREGHISSDKNYSFSGHQEQRKGTKLRSGSYPLDPYNSVLLDHDRHTGELLLQLNSTGSPSFHDYGTAPPSSVLDLGCGQGHWVLEAAIAWKDYGTKVIGFDMIDISRNLLPWATEKGVVDNIKFVRGNFLKQQLPFGNNTFDLVRMSCLALCITSDAWGFVLQEVCRVLMTGGRLELIDDQLFFPYLMNDASYPTATTFNSDSVHSPSAPSSRKSGATMPIQPRFNASPGLSPEQWHRGLAISEGMETLFEHMLLDHFDIHKDPSDFILSFMNKVFGQAREVNTMHIVLAPSDFADAPIGLSHCPGLILCPSTFIPMDRTEIEIHASKYPRTLMSCKKFISEYAVDISGDERVDEDFVSEAIWEYESFLPHRFDPPVPSSDDYPHSEEISETASIRGSIAESAMLEIQSEFRQRFAWVPEKDPLNIFNSSQDNTSVRPRPSPPDSLYSGSAARDHGSSAASSASLEATHIRTFRVYEATKLDNYVPSHDTH